jgi:NADH-quinone oxidoreductase E subunit
MGKSKENLLILLQEAQNKSGYLSQELMVELAKSINVSLSDIYGVATFYSYLSTKPQAKNVIRICKSVPCYLKNSQMIIEAVGNEVGIKPGETTPDDKFSLQFTNCIGACDKAPAMMINHEVYSDLNPNKIAQILKSYL